MNDENKEFVLSDGMSLETTGPTIIFVRPRRELSHEEVSNVLKGLDHISVHLTKTHERSITCVLVPHEFDVMAAGESDLQRLGWTKLPIPQ